MSDFVIMPKTDWKASLDALRSGNGSQTLYTSDEVASGIEELATIPAKMLDGTITTINNSSITQLGEYACASRRELTSVCLPNVVTMGEYAFFGCTFLSSVSMPKLTAVPRSGFQACQFLGVVDLPVVTQIGDKGFLGCGNYSAVFALVLRSGTLCTLSATSAFTNSAIAKGNAYIYVPSALIDEYKAATNWATYASQFRVLEDYTVDGTVTGELDTTKI